MTLKSHRILDWERTTVDNWMDRWIQWITNPYRPAWLHAALLPFIAVMWVILIICFVMFVLWFDIFGPRT